MFSLLKDIFRPATVKTAVKVAVIVGLLLNTINQGELLLAANWGAVNWTKFTLTFFVPFGVSVYSAWQARRRMDNILKMHNLPDSNTLGCTIPQIPSGKQPV